MSKSRNNLTSLLKQYQPTLPDTGLSSGSQSPLRPGAQGLLRSNSLGNNSEAKGIDFGKAPSSRIASNHSGSEWTNLLQQTASGGLSSVLGGGLGLSGLGSIISGIVSLFGGGGKKSPPPLVDFHLPAAQNQSVSIGSAANGAYQGAATRLITPQSPNTGAPHDGSTQGAGNVGSSQWIQDQSSEIAQAVKTAMLHSSSLNDVVAEL